MDSWHPLTNKSFSPSFPLSLALPLSVPSIGGPFLALAWPYTQLSFSPKYILMFGMFAKSTFLIILFSLTPFTMSREIFLERDGKAIISRALVPRRFGEEQCGGLPQQIGAACRGEVCGVLGGKSSTFLKCPRRPNLMHFFPVGTLLAAALECAQQDLADDIIDASKKEDATTAAKMVEVSYLLTMSWRPAANPLQLAIKFRKCEKNTPPDFTTNPPTPRNSVFCQKAPRNHQLDGLVQAQDPANGPNLFFDPVTKSTVVKGSQPNTFPFSGGNAATTRATAAAESTSTAWSAATSTDGKLVLLSIGYSRLLMLLSQSPPLLVPLRLL